MGGSRNGRYNICSNKTQMFTTEYLSFIFVPLSCALRSATSLRSSPARAWATFSSPGRAPTTSPSTTLSKPRTHRCAAPSTRRPPPRPPPLPIPLLLRLLPLLPLPLPALLLPALPLLLLPHHHLPRLLPLLPLPLPPPSPLPPLPANSAQRFASPRTARAAPPPPPPPPATPSPPT